MLAFNDHQKIGVGLTGFGLLFSFLGVLFFFDRGLLAIGNVLFLVGITMTIGTQATIKFFMRRKNVKGSSFFLGGAFLVVIGWTFIGLMLQVYGFWLLFSAFFPAVLQWLRKVPLLGKVLDLPILKTVLNRVAPAGGLPI